MTITSRPFSVQVSSELPVGAGLGSSASFSVCIAALLLLHYGIISDCEAYKNKETINNWAFLAEKVIHGTPSGIDNTMSTFGGLMAYKRNMQDEKAETLLLESVQALEFLLVDTRQSRNTKALVQLVKRNLDSASVLCDFILYH